MTEFAGLSGKARSGKDTFGNFLIEQHNFVPYSFASPIKNAVNEMFGWNHEEHSDGDLKEVTLEVKTDIITMTEAIKNHIGEDDDLYGWDKHKSCLRWLYVLMKHDAIIDIKKLDFWFEISPRKAYQLFGTDFGRDLIDENIWLDKANQFASNHEKVLLTDVRFENEAAWLRENEGQLIFIERDNIEQNVRAHASEAGVKKEDGDITIKNNGTIEDLENLAKNYS